MEKLLNVFASESIFSFDFFRNGLFGEKIASVLDVDGDLCRIIALILSLILAAAVLTMAAERFETAAITFRTRYGSAVHRGGSGNYCSIYSIKRQRNRTCSRIAEAVTEEEMA